MDYFHLLDKNDTLLLIQELLLKTLISVFTRICQRIATFFKMNVNKILSLYKATKYQYPIESSKVKVLTEYEFLIPKSN